MPILRSTLLCALSACILFSCKPNFESRKADAAAESAEAIKKPLTELVRDENLNMSNYQEAFINSTKKHYNVSAKKITILKLKSGLKITVNPAVLENANGSELQGIIAVDVVELRNADELFKANVATVSNGKLLVSGGSYYIGMNNNGRELRIQKGKTLEVEFPVLENNDMELFYGKRDDINNMNWLPADQDLSKQYDSISFTDKPFSFNHPDLTPLQEIAQPRVFRSLDSRVYLNNTSMTLKQLVDTVNKKEVNVSLTTISFWPKNLPPDRRLDTNFLTAMYGPRLQYILRTCKEMERDIVNEQNKTKREIAYKAALELQQAEYKNWQANSLISRIQKNYAPAAITELGWINCDRFYNVPQTETIVNIPYAFQNARISYFVIFRSFNGLLNGNVLCAENNFVLSNMPAGASITLVAFIKKDGVVYQGREEFVIDKGKPLQLNFNEISTDELNKIFGAIAKL